MVQTINSEYPEEYDGYASSVGISNGRIIVGAPQDEFDENGANELIGAGKIYIYEAPTPQGINTLASSEGVILYPNPCNGRLSIDITSSTFGEGTLVTLRDNSGRQILQKHIVSDRSFMDLSEMANGIYTLRFENNKLVATEKIIITH